VQRDPVLYTTGDDHRAEREKKLGLTRKYQQQVARALGFDVFSTPQGGGYPWANIPSFDPPAPDSDYVYRDQNFDSAYEQPHDNYHGWVGPDMADNAYTAFDPVFWSYHANCHRPHVGDLAARASRGAVHRQHVAAPFAGPRAETLVFDDPRRFAYTTIGDIARTAAASATISPRLSIPTTSLTIRTPPGVPPAPNRPAFALSRHPRKRRQQRNRRRSGMNC
jgi:tyrosinase